MGLDIYINKRYYPRNNKSVKCGNVELNNVSYINVDGINFSGFGGFHNYLGREEDIGVDNGCDYYLSQDVVDNVCKILTDLFQSIIGFNSWNVSIENIENLSTIELYNLFDNCPVALIDAGELETVFTENDDNSRFITPEDYLTSIRLYRFLHEHCKCLEKRKRLGNESEFIVELWYSATW